jgi:hypothetical protein
MEHLHFRVLAGQLITSGFFHLLMQVGILMCDFVCSKGAKAGIGGLIY